jgi:hypothetical protein
VSQPRSITILRFLDVVVVLVAAIPALALGAPALGYVVGGCGWIVARLIQINEYRLTAGIADPTRAVGARLFGAFGRVFLLAGAIVIAAVAGARRDGLTAALVVFAAYSVAFVIRLMSGPPPPRTQEPR